MKYTTNYNLKKPEIQDLASPLEFDYNFDIVDTELYKKADKTTVYTKEETSALINTKTQVSDTTSTSTTTWSSTKINTELSKKSDTHTHPYMASSYIPTWLDVLNKPSFSTVATSGSYTDLSNKPTIPSITGLATETYVNTKITDAINSIPIPEEPIFYSHSMSNYSDVTLVQGIQRVDNLASLGKCVSFITNATTTQILETKFNDLNYGNYIVCLRLAVNSLSSNNVASLKLCAREGTTDTDIVTKDIVGTLFTKVDEYIQIFVNVQLTGSTTGRRDLVLKLYSHNLSNTIRLSYDYAYASLLTPAIYI